MKVGQLRQRYVFGLLAMSWTRTISRIGVRVEIELDCRHQSKPFVVELSHRSEEHAHAANYPLGWLCDRRWRSPAERLARNV